MFSEMVGWAVDEGTGHFNPEAFYFAEEALTVPEVIQQSKRPAVMPTAPVGENILRENMICNFGM